MHSTPSKLLCSEFFFFSFWSRCSWILMIQLQQLHLWMTVCFLAFVACLFMIYCEWFIVVVTNLCFNVDLISAPNRKYLENSCFLRAPLGARIEQHLYDIFAWVGWLNIGLVAARPVPAALVILCFPFTWFPLELWCTSPHAPLISEMSSWRESWVHTAHTWV